MSELYIFVHGNNKENTRVIETETKQQFGYNVFICFHICGSLRCVFGPRRDEDLRGRGHTQSVCPTQRKPERAIEAEGQREEDT